MKQISSRLSSIDSFRAVNMLLMVFVNDLSERVPVWLKHVDANTDGMGFADIIFPIFLYIVGLSLPFALKKRMDRGDSAFSIIRYIFFRSLALIVMGFFHVNLENYSSSAFLPEPIWEILITVSFFLIWLDYPAEMQRKKRMLLQGTGIILLIVMALLFKGGDASYPVGLKPYWGGILGIIGWSYLVCACLFLLSKGKFVLQLAALVLFMFINTAVDTHLIRSFPVIGDGSAESLTMAGVVTSVLYSRLKGHGRINLLWVIFTIAGCFMIIFGLIIRPYAGGISKIHSTPAWVAICTGIGILTFELIIFLVDIKGRQNWFSIIKPAGTSTLTCYLLPYIISALFSLAHIRFPGILRENYGAITKSMLFAFIVVLMTGWLEKKRIRLKI